MTFPNLATLARDRHGAQRWVLVAVLLLASVVFGLIAGLSPVSNSTVALWWPSAGFNVIAVLAVGRRYRPIVLLLVMLTTIPISLFSGRALAVAVMGSFAVAIEAWIVARFSVRDGDTPRLSTMFDVVRFFSGSIAASAFTGVVTGSVVVLTNSDANFAETAFSITASHASAIAVIVPLVLVNRERKRQGSVLSYAVHSSVLAVAVFVSFAPGSVAPLAFLPVPFLAWSAFAFSMYFSLFQLIGVSGLVVVLTALGGGPFAAYENSWLAAAALVQLYVLTLAVTALFIGAARNQRQRLEEQKDATAKLLHDGFEQAQNGFALMQEEKGVFRMLDVNASAKSLLESSFNTAGELSVDSRLRRLFQTLADSRLTTMTEQWDDETSIPAIVTVSRVINSTFGEIMLVAVVDLRPVRAAEQRMQFQIDREQIVVEELRALNQQKDDFISSVTHELRTPITTVMGFAEELDDTPLNDEQRSYLTIIQRNADRLLSVIEDVLTFSRRPPESEVQEETLRRVDVSTVIVSTLEDVAHLVRDKRIDIRVDLPTEPIWVFVNPNDLTRVVINLITNAVKFTPADGSISFSTLSGRGTATINMIDSGPGIARADLEKVFDRFYRAKRTTQDGIPGTGLGLSIVRQLVESMNGEVTLDSDGVNGTTARLTLPVMTV